MPPILKRTFESIGLNEKESIVLGFLLQTGPMLSSNLAQKVGLNRTSVYSILKELTNKGLISTTRKSGVTRYQSIDPALLPDYLVRKQDELAKQEESLREILPQLVLQREKSALLPKVQFFQGVEGMKQAYEDTLENNEQKNLYDLTGVGAVLKRMGTEWLQYYLKKRVQLGIRCINIAPDSVWARESKEDDEKYNRITKLLPAKFSFDSEIDIYDNKIGIFSFAQDNPVAIISEDDTIARTMKTLFNYIDETLR